MAKEVVCVNGAVFTRKNTIVLPSKVRRGRKEYVYGYAAVRLPRELLGKRIEIIVVVPE